VRLGDDARLPTLYEINARFLIERESKRRGRRVTLGTLDDRLWRLLAGFGIDHVWLMGIWRRSPAARQAALSHPGLRETCAHVLPGCTEQDVVASPYAVWSYEPDPAVGTADDLAALRERIHACGLRLVVDFVPNHLAIDHPWLLAHPERFVRVAAETARGRVGEVFTTDGTLWFAHGRDPYFPPWTDTAQVDAFAPSLRAAFAAELTRIAGLADGVRCDMAMLLLNDVFERVWGAWVPEPRPRTELWAEVIGAVRAERPDFVFIAEAYWGLEGALRQLGFDYCYDKALYDLLRAGDAAAVRGHVVERGAELAHGVHFVENHDEPRAATVFAPDHGRAAAVVVATLPGMTLWHDGQLDGRRRQLPVQLAREPDEPGDPALLAFHERLLGVTALPACRAGTFHVETVTARDGDPSSRHVLAWRRQHHGVTMIVTVNLSPHPARGMVPAPVGTMLDRLTGDSRRSEGWLALELEPFGARIWTDER
jgi:hypothetical protein